jgi:RHS repeat-associated protein
MYDQSGGRVWQGELDSFGAIQNFKGDSKTDCPFRYQGQYEDAETGLYYNRFRYYSPEEGIYLSQDQAGLAGGGRLYSYVKDPLCYLDILGFEDIWYRALSPQDMKSLDEGKGIIPKSPLASQAPLDHVLKGSTPGYGDQYTSLTKSKKFAEGWAKRAGTEVAEIDLDLVHNKKLDLTTPEGRKLHLGDASKAAEGSDVWKANKYAKGAKELLVEGTITQGAIIDRFDPC